jgi:hypothetical protein
MSSWVADTILPPLKEGGFRLTEQDSSRPPTRIRRGLLDDQSSLQNLRPLGTRGVYLVDQGGRLDAPESMTRRMGDDRAGVSVFDLDLML